MSRHDCLLNGSKSRLLNFLKFLIKEALNRTQNGNDITILLQGTAFLMSSTLTLFSCRNRTSSIVIFLHFDGESLTNSYKKRER